MSAGNKLTNEKLAASGNKERLKRAQPLLHLLHITRHSSSSDNLTRFIFCIAQSLSRRGNRHGRYAITLDWASELRIFLDVEHGLAVLGARHADSEYTRIPPDAPSMPILLQSCSIVSRGSASDTSYSKREPQLTVSFVNRPFPLSSTRVCLLTLTISG